jgi:hypothetical protein
VVVLAVFHDGDPAAAEKAIEPLRKFGETVGEHVGQMPYTAWQQAFDALLGPGAATTGSRTTSRGSRMGRSTP